MLNIFICEDIKEHRQFICETINTAILLEKYHSEIVLDTDNPHKIISYLKENNCIGLYFIDISLECDMDGFELAKHIRELDPVGFIIFLTANATSQNLTFFYKLEAFDYIVKTDYDNMIENIKQCLETVYKRYLSKITTLQKSFSFSIKDEVYNILLTNIMYFSSGAHRKIIVHTQHKDFEFYGTMKEIEQQLDNNFFRCHRSFIINHLFVSHISLPKKTITLTNKVVCPISRTKINAYKKYIQLG